MFEKWMATFSRTGPDRLVKDVLIFPEHLHLRKTFHLFLDLDFRMVLHDGNRSETKNRKNQGIQ